MNIPDDNQSVAPLFRGRYRIYPNEIGSGSFARVYRALDIQTSNTVAIKKISLINLPLKLVERFHREIEIMRELDHPNIAHLFDSYISDRSIYLILEYCNGGSFRQFHMNGECEYQLYFRQIFSALQYLNQSGIVHRDIKPDNILISTGLDGTNTLKLVDFGFANYIPSEQEMLSTICGTPLYMSPELLRGRAYRSNSDIWSIGVILFEYVFQHYPFGKPKSMIELIQQIEGQKDSPVNVEKRKVSPELEDLLRRLLETDYEKRIGYEAILNHPWFLLHFDDPDDNTIEEGIFDMDEEGFASPDKKPSSVFQKTPKIEPDSGSREYIIEDYYPKPERIEMVLSLSGSFGSLPTLRIGSNNSISPLFSYGWKKSVGAMKNILGTY